MPTTQIALANPADSVAILLNVGHCDCTINCDDWNCGQFAEYLELKSTPIAIALSVPKPTKGAGMLRRAVRSQAFAGILGGRHMECAYYFDFCRLYLPVCRSANLANLAFSADPATRCEKCLAYRFSGRCARRSNLAELATNSLATLASGNCRSRPMRS